MANKMISYNIYWVHNDLYLPPIALSPKFYLIASSWGLKYNITENEIQEKKKLFKLRILSLTLLE